MSIALETPGVKPTRPEAQAPESTAAPSSETQAREGRKARAASIDQRQLPQPDRGLWEEAVLKGLDDKALDHLVRALFDSARGKADCFPSNKTLVKKVKLSEKNGDRHVRRLLNELAVRGVVALVNDPSIQSRRRIVFLSHPNAEAVLAALPTGANVRPKPDKMSASMSASHPDKMSASRWAPMSGGGGHPDPPNLKGKPEEETSLKTTQQPKSGASSRADATACEGGPGTDATLRPASGDGGCCVADDSDGGDGDDWDVRLVEYVRRLAAEVKRLGERIELDDLAVFRVWYDPDDTPEAMAARVVAKYAELAAEEASFEPTAEELAEALAGVDASLRSDYFRRTIGFVPEDHDDDAGLACPCELCEQLDPKFIEAKAARRAAAGMIAGDDDPDDPPPTNPGGPDPTTTPEKAPEPPQGATEATGTSIPSSEARESLPGDPRPSGGKAVARESYEEAERKRLARNELDSIARQKAVLADISAKPWQRDAAAKFLAARGLLEPTETTPAARQAPPIADAEDEHRPEWSEAQPDPEEEWEYLAVFGRPSINTETPEPIPAAC